jgi:hypothetical protein
LPNHPDVVLVGSSVIAEPLVYYEFPGNLPITFLEQHPVDRARRLEAAVAPHGNISVWSGSVIGQNIFGTVNFVRDSLSMNKQPHVAVLFISPVSVCGSTAAPLDPSPTWWTKLIESGKSAIDKQLEWSREIRRRLIILAHIVRHKSTADISSEERAKRWADFDFHYSIYYKSGLNDGQLRAISQFLDICQRRSIKALIVSTPLTQENRALLRGFKYVDYRQALERICENRCRFVDLGESSEFHSPDDFLDGAHCNAKGAEKMYRIIAPYLVQLRN